MSGKRPRRGEFEIIAELFAPLARQAPGALGLTDDAAIIDVAPGRQLVVTTDTVIAGIHFRDGDPPDMVARKALRVNLSDLAAKGARPIGFLQALALNPSIDDGYLEKYAAGLAQDVETFAVPLLGGDTTSGPGPFSITITAFGEVEKGRVLLRSGGRRGDILCVSGTIGDGALGLACLNSALHLPAGLAEAVVARYRIPEPRLALGQALGNVASACLDISDGLAADFGHLCRTSGLAATIDCEKIPLSPAARAAVSLDGQWWDTILGGGDDYELAFAVPPEQLPALKVLSDALKVPLTPIGTLSDAEDSIGVKVLSGGVAMNISRPGYRHR